MVVLTTNNNCLYHKRSGYCISNYKYSTVCVQPCNTYSKYQSQFLTTSQTSSPRNSAAKSHMHEGLYTCRNHFVSTWYSIWPMADSTTYTEQLSPSSHFPVALTYCCVSDGRSQKHRSATHNRSNPDQVVQQPSPTPQHVAHNTQASNTGKQCLLL